MFLFVYTSCHRGYDFVSVCLLVVVSVCEINYPERILDDILSWFLEVVGIVWQTVDLILGMVWIQSMNLYSLKIVQLFDAEDVFCEESRC